MIGPDGVFAPRSPTATAWRWRRRAASAARYDPTFAEVQLTPTVWRNMPPAFVYVCRTRGYIAATGRVPLREILRLAGPALPVLAAEPLYLLVDTAVVGRLGAVPLAGLAVAGVVFAQVTSQLNFLSYGTTARTARLHGAGRRSAAVGEGVRRPGSPSRSGWWSSGSASSSSAGRGCSATGRDPAAESWLRAALFGAPLVLVTWPATGGCGVCRTPPARCGTCWPATACRRCCACHWCTASGRSAGWVWSGPRSPTGRSGGGRRAVPAPAASQSGPSPRPSTRCRCAPCPAAARAAGDGARPARPSLAFQACFLSAAAVAARFGAASVAAHGGPAAVVLHGAGPRRHGDRRAVARRGRAGRRWRAPGQIVGLASRGLRLVLGSGFGAVALAASVLPNVFTDEPIGAGGEMVVPWWFLVAQLPAIAGVCFRARRGAARLRRYTIHADRHIK